MDKLDFGITIFLNIWLGFIFGMSLIVTPLWIVKVIGFSLAWLCLMIFMWAGLLVSIFLKTKFDFAAFLPQRSIRK